MPPSVLRSASACAPARADCTARRGLPRCSGQPSHARSGGPSRPAAPRWPDPSLPERWRAPISRALTRPSCSRRARRRSSSEPMSSRIANADIVASPSPDHNICYSRNPFDATLLARQHQLRTVIGLCALCNEGLQRHYTKARALPSVSAILNRHCGLTATALRLLRSAATPQDPPQFFCQLVPSERLS